MIVMNFRLKRKNILITAAVIIGLIIIMIIAFSGKGNSTPKENAILEADLIGSSNEERIEFLKKMGYEPSPTEIEMRDVVIPFEFNDVYENYNTLQKQQGFDLKKYSGCRVTRYCYEIKNYEGYDKTVYANLLIYEGKIIGGDISAAELDGFMHTFDKSAKLENISG